MPARGRFEVRVRPRGGQWSPWVPLAVHGDHAPDTGSGERASDPVWAGGCDELQLRFSGRLRGALRVHFVAVPAAGRQSLRARVAAAPKQQAAPQPGTPPPIIPRSAWGGDSVPPRSAPSYGVVQMGFVHHTVTANDYTPDQSASIVLGIAEYHRDTNGWNDIGYNFLVDQYGQVFEGRAGGIDQAVIGAQAQGYNSQSTGVAVLGTFSDVPIAEAAMAAITQLLGWKLSLHGVPCEGGLTIVSGGGSLNRYPSGTPVAIQRISGPPRRRRHRVPGHRPLRASSPSCAAAPRRWRGRSSPRGVVSLRHVGRGDQLRGRRRFTGRSSAPTRPRAQTRPSRCRSAGTGGGWAIVARTTALVDGSWVVRVPWRRGADVPAVSAGVTSKAIAVLVNPALTTRRTSKRVSAGSSVGLSGRVRPWSPSPCWLSARGPTGSSTACASWRARAPDELARRGAPAQPRPVPAHGAHRRQGGNVHGTSLYVRAVR